MDNAFVVQVSDCEAELAKDDLCFVFCQSALFYKVVEELATAAELCYDPDGGLGCNDFVHLGDMRMMELTVMVNFTSEDGGHGLWDLLDGDAGGGNAMGSETNLAICTCGA